MFQTIRPHLVVKLVHVMAPSKRWNDFSSDDEEPDKILRPGILSTSIGGVDSEAHQALHNVQACLSYQYWSVRHRSFQRGFNIGSNCPRPNRILMPMEACLGIMATFNLIKSMQTVAGMLDKSPLLNEAGKSVYWDWVDVACLRADEPPLKMRRREQNDCVGCKNA